jgi:rhamnulokinase
VTNGNREVFLAADLGASSGRLVAGVFDGRQIQLEEIHRFENGGVEVADHLCWDFQGLWKQLETGLSRAASEYRDSVISLGVDTWGVDFGLLDSNDQLLANPRHYRDQSQEILETAFAMVPREEIFQHTGLQFMEFNSLYQLLALKLENPSLLETAASLLMIPDLMHWMLSGEKANEFTNATTTQMLDPRTGDWALPLLDRFSLPSGILQQVTAPGTVLGPLQAGVSDTTGLRDVKVVLPGTHDTASAVMAVPVDARTQASGRWCYISSGTWSLMGAEIPEPVINDRCLQLNFTNEGGVGQTVRLLKNIAGLWLVQQCRAAWASEKDYDWEQLVSMAEESPARTCLIDPDDACFVAPREMPEEIQRYCQQSSQPVPETKGAVIRCALESLALRYRMVLELLEELTGRSIETIHIVGGGSRNRLLCQMTADACNRTVIAGPVEATAIGNLMMQLVAAGAVASISQAREVVRASFEVEQYIPADPDAWHEAAGRFAGLLES